MALDVQETLKQYLDRHFPILGTQKNIFLKMNQCGSKEIRTYVLKDTTKNRCVTLAQSYWRNRETQNSIGTLYLKEAEDLLVAWVIHTTTNVLPSKIMFHQRYIKLRNRCQCFCQK